MTSRTEAMQVASGTLVRSSSVLTDANGTPIHFEQNIAFAPNVTIGKNEFDGSAYLI